MSAKQLKRLAKKEAQKLLFPEVRNAIITKVNEPVLRLENNSLSDNLSSSCGTSEQSDSENLFNLCDGLAKWATQFGVSFAAVDELLLLLRKCDITVPKDARTLLKTPNCVIKRQVGEGTYTHYGLKEGLTDFLVLNDWK